VWCTFVLIVKSRFPKICFRSHDYVEIIIYCVLQACYMAVNFKNHPKALCKSPEMVSRDCWLQTALVKYFSFGLQNVFIFWSIETTVLTGCYSWYFSGFLLLFASESVFITNIVCLINVWVIIIIIYYYYYYYIFIIIAFAKLKINVKMILIGLNVVQRWM